MIKYLITIIFITLLPSISHSLEAPVDMKEFNANCPANKLCPELEKQYEACKNNPNSGACLKYIEIFKKLVPAYDCQRATDHIPDKDYIVPAIWMCRPRPNRLWDYIVLLSESEIPEVKEFFASPEFRSILDGEFAEVFFDKSLEKETELKTIKR